MKHGKPLDQALKKGSNYLTESLAFLIHSVSSLFLLLIDLSKNHVYSAESSNNYISRI